MLVDIVTSRFGHGDHPKEIQCCMCIIINDPALNHIVENRNVIKFNEIHIIFILYIYIIYTVWCSH